MILQIGRAAVVAQTTAKVKIRCQMSFKCDQVMDSRSKEYGPIYKETIGNLTSVIISDLDEYSKVIHVDGKFPNRIEMEPLAHYRRKRKMGLGTVNG